MDVSQGSGAEILSSRVDVTIDGVAGHGLLAVCDRDGQIALSLDGAPLASSERSAEAGLHALRTARKSVLDAGQVVLEKLDSLLAGELARPDLPAAQRDRITKGRGNIQSLRALYSQI